MSVVSVSNPSWTCPDALEPLEGLEAYPSQLVLIILDVPMMLLLLMILMMLMTHWCAYDMVVLEAFSVLFSPN